MTRMRQAIGLVIAVVVCLGAAGVGSWLTLPSIGTWYAALAKPAWNPPNWVFGPVWTVLYLSMAVAAWLVWRESQTRSVSVPLALFAVQLALNVAWSGIFFYLHQIGAAVVAVLALWTFILATLLSFRRVSRAAALLMAPYLAWVSFASYLNFTVWKLNR
jgi:tryptophan-rich sensory protein